MKVIIVSGPTASGKTSLSIDLATKLGGEIVNFDSLLLYKEINIGTAKPTLEERKLVPHHMVDVRSIADPMNAADYSRTTLPLVENLLNQKKIVYLVGGSGFYLQALLKGMYDSPTTPLDVKERSEMLYQAEGIEPFLKILAGCDPVSFGMYHKNDHYRVRRAVEHWWAHQTPLSQERMKKDLSNKNVEASVHGWSVLHLHLDLPKEEHSQIIEKRTHEMLSHGLLKEVESLLQNGFSGLEKPLQSIGYKEALDFHFGVLKNIKECEERINISTRQLAKAQRTWFKRDHSKETFHPLQQRPLILSQAEKFLSE